MNAYDHLTILDHGYLAFIESWGSDKRIIESARMSTGKGFKGWGTHCINPDCGLPIDKSDALGFDTNSLPFYDDGILGDTLYCTCDSPSPERGDEHLLRYLYEHAHHTPFEMAGLTIEVQAPIFVFREWHRHRTQSYNEMSARYVQMPNLHYIPSIERIMAGCQDNINKQGSGIGAMTQEKAEHVRTYLAEVQQHLYTQYEQLLADGLSKELARINTPVSRYSRMRASANLRNWLSFLTLRMDPHAQWEIRQYANALGELIKKRFPRTWFLFDDKGGINR